jgi:hypothetical protein
MDREKLPWCVWWTFRKRCKAKLPKGADPLFHGRCEFEHGHSMELGDGHCLERKSLFVFWNKLGVWYEES